MDVPLPLLAPLAPLLALIARADLAERRIPNALTGAGALIALALLALAAPDALLAHLAWGTGVGAALIALHVVAPDGLGMGDVKLGALLGLFLAADVVPALLAGFLAAALAGAAIAARDGVAWARGATLPLAPFLALGVVAAVALGALASA